MTRCSTVLSGHLIFAGMYFHIKLATGLEMESWQLLLSGRSAIQIPEEIKKSVVRLQAPNPNAPDGRTDVYLLGMSHVSQESVKAVRTLIEATKPEVINWYFSFESVNLDQQLSNYTYDHILLAIRWSLHIGINMIGAVNAAIVVSKLSVTSVYCFFSTLSFLPWAVSCWLCFNYLRVTFLYAYTYSAIFIEG